MDTFSSHATNSKQDENRVVQHDAATAAVFVAGLWRRKYYMTDDSTDGHNYNPDNDSENTANNDIIANDKNCALLKLRGRCF